MSTATVNNNNSAALLLQNQNSGILKNSSVSGTASVASDPLQAAWSKMVNDLKVDYTTFIKPLSQEINEGVTEISKIVDKDFKVFATALDKNIKTQVDALMVTLNKEANEDLKPQLQIFATKIEKNLQSTGQKVLSDIWDEALPILIDTAKISMATISSGAGFSPAALSTIAVQVMESPHMKELIAELNRELSVGMNNALKDTQDTWKAIEPTINGDIKNALTGFGASVIATTTIQSAVFSANLTKDIAAEVNELHNEYSAVNSKNFTTMAKDLLNDAAKVATEVSKKVSSGAKSLFSKIKRLFK